MIRIHACILLIAAGLTGCGGSTSDVSTPSEASVRPADSAQPTGALPPSGARLVLGNGTKGPLVNATVEIFALSVNGFSEGGALASTQTDAAGNWQLDVNRPDAVLVRISGGSYVDEADTNVNNRRVVELASDQFLESVLLPGEDTVAVTVFTHALLQKSRRETGQNNFDEVISNNRALFSQAYGFDVLSVLPADPLAPSGTDESVAYAMSVGGVANAINALSIASNSALPEYVHILDVVEDLVDCRLDGVGTGGQQIINPALADYQELSLQQQVLRFRNNNFSAYEGFSQNPVNSLPCDELGGIADTTAPTVTSFADQPVFEAVSPEGLALTDVQLAALRDQFVASDDREGALEWNVEIPQQLEIGTTPLTASVKDVWGNTTNVDWEVTVADTTPPGIEGQSAVEAQAQGDITFIELARPEVSDRVSSQNQIDVSNDAPGGFPVGPTLVVWTAQDEAGNASTFDQMVTINSVAPEVMPAPPTIDTDQGDIDFSVFFNDPDGTTLTYSVVGLPDGTGLAIDPATGVLTGTPTPADLAVQPIVLTISASDGQNVVSLQTILNIVAPNTPPAFSVSQASITQDEDFANVVVQIQPAQVPDSEIDQQVVYSVRFDSLTAEDEAPFSVIFDADTLVLQLVSKADANGEAIFSVIADDGQSSQSEFVQQVSVQVLPVNDAPLLVGTDEPLNLVVGESFDFSLSSRASDVDNAVLDFVAARLPAGMNIDANGTLSGMALPADALSEEIELVVTARDDQNESVDFIVTVIVVNPDSDGDGLSNYLEQLIGTNAALADTDGDSLGDSIEYLVDTDTTVTNVLYVTATGDDTLAGNSPASALATLDEVSIRLALLPADQSALVLIEHDSAVQGALELSGRERAVIGSVDFATLQVVGVDDNSTSPTSRLSTAGRRALVVNDCQSCSVFNLRINGGSGIQVSDSDVTLKRLHVIGSSALDGGALWSQQSQIIASDLHLVLNRAKYGGAIALDSDSSLIISDSTLSGNLAHQSGGAVIVLDSTMTAHNVVFSANTAPIAAVVDVMAGSANLSNTTVAYNLIKSLTSVQLFRCRSALVGACSDDTAITLQDSLVAGNRNASDQTVDMADILSTGQGNFVEPDRASAFASGLSSSEPYAVGYTSDDERVLNAGSRSALEASLEGYFSEVDSVFTDSDQVEPGVHLKTPILSINNYAATAMLSENGFPFGLQSVDIGFSQGSQPVGGLHRVSVVVTSDNDRAIAVSTGTIPGDPLNPVPAISLGDGRYRIWLTNDFVIGRDFLYLRLDDDTVGVEVLPVCQQSACGTADVTVTNLPGTGVRDERVTPVLNNAD